MTEHDTIEPELEQRARDLFAVAATDVRTSGALDERVLGASAERQPGTAFRWVAVAAAFGLLAGGVWGVLGGDDSSNVDVRNEPVAPTSDAWWSELDESWTNLPTLPEPGSPHRARATESFVDLVFDGLTWGGSLVLDENGWNRAPMSKAGGAWFDVAWGRDDGADLLVATRQETGPGYGSFTVHSRSLQSQVSSTPSIDSWIPLGRAEVVDSYLTAGPALLAVPGRAGGGVALFSHEDGDAGGGLTVERVGAGREPIGTIPMPNLRPLAVGVSPDGEPVVLTQVIDGSRLPSMLIAWALTADGTWSARGSATFGEADARWLGDRFVVVTNQEDAPRGSAAVELVLGPVGSDTRWRALADPGIGSCEGAVELVSDDQGGVVATSCNRSAYLAPAESKWKPVPESDDGWNIPVAMWDGRLVALVHSDPSAGGLPGERIRAIDLRPDR